MARALFIAAVAFCFSAVAEPLQDVRLQHYFEGRVREISSNAVSKVTTREQWDELKPQLRAQLLEMLGLSPLPEKSDLHATITGTIERDGVVVEKLHFQSSPGLYVTGNFYLPKKRAGPLPTILYVCGHSIVKTNGISYGNKTAYQHHGAWFARNGYACLIIDTIEAGEIQGEHHGTYNKGMWWWNSRGYTPAGVEAWNCMRALDYLETRPEVDKSRFGVTGRSGGGAYSWWITALDDRIKVAAPVAGITDLQNQVVDGVVEGHCDCMFFVNTYRWDYPLVVALAAPRPLLLCNSDKDTIFPLDGVVRTHAFAKKVYDLYGASKNLGLLITEGPHQDTQDLQLPVFRWFNRHLKGEDPVIEMAATKFFTPAELKVFGELPADERTSRIHETFRPESKSPMISDEKFFQKCFGAWPTRGLSNPPAAPKPYNEIEWQRDGRDVRSLTFDSETKMPLRLIYLLPKKPERLELHILTGDDFAALGDAMHAEFGIDVPDTSASGAAPESLRRALKPDAHTAVAFLLIRGEGSGEPKKAVQIRRRYMLVGTTLEAMRVWDIGRGVDLLRSLRAFRSLPLHITAHGRDASNLLVSLATGDQISRNFGDIFPDSITLINAPKTDLEQPDYLNFDRFSSWRQVRQSIAAAHPALVIEEKQSD